MIRTNHNLILISLFKCELRPRSRPKYQKQWIVINKNFIAFVEQNHNYVRNSSNRVDVIFIFSSLSTDLLNKYESNYFSMFLKKINTKVIKLSKTSSTQIKILQNYLLSDTSDWMT